MASTILGKRTRSGRDSPVPSSISTRVKRRAHSSVIGDENDNPFDTRSTRKAAQDVDIMDVYGLADPVRTPTKSSKKPSVPIKHTIAGKRVALSPTKINTLFRTTKAIPDENTKIEEVKIPKTPRHRDALSKKIPVTPKHRFAVIAKPLTPSTPRTPATPSNSLPTVYGAARQLFMRSANPGRLVGRDAERNELDDFIRSRVQSRSGGCLYISGPPGTGKSALVNEVCEDFKSMESVKTAYINCMSLKDSKDVYGKLIGSLCSDNDTVEGNEMNTLYRTLASKKDITNDVFVVTLDEIDHLLTLDLEILYTLFEWSLQRSSRLILVGIANALDLADRFLPRLKSRNLKPQLLPLLPYTASQITSVITSRLMSLVAADAASAPDYVPFLHPAAIQLCSRKVASQTGDLRKAFDICGRAIDLIGSETKSKHRKEIDESAAIPFSPTKTPLIENMNLSSPPSSASLSGKPTRTLTDSLAELTPENAPRATIAHVARIASSAFGNGTVQRLATLNLQQKATLCALVALEKKKRNSPCNTIFATPSKTAKAAPTVRALFDAYSGLCKRDGMLQSLSSTEFRDVVGSLETLSLISGAEGRNGSFVGLFGTPSKKGKGGFGVGMGDERRIASCAGEKELEAAVQGVGSGILKGILSGEGLE
ncbi:MAG: AAA ATPase [Pycnora praestabilis]|nr:MAG: AAA ATPase [Pycnora praestabilis]